MVGAFVFVLTGSFGLALAADCGAADWADQSHGGDHIYALLAQVSSRTAGAKADPAPGFRTDGSKCERACAMSL